MGYGFGAGEFCELVVAGDGEGGCAGGTTDGEFVVRTVIASKSSGGCARGR